MANLEEAVMETGNPIRSNVAQALRSFFAPASTRWRRAPAPEDKASTIRLGPVSNIEATTAERRTAAAEGKVTHVLTIFVIDAVAGTVMFLLLALPVALMELLRTYCAAHGLDQSLLWPISISQFVIIGADGALFGVFLARATWSAIMHICKMP